MLFTPRTSNRINDRYALVVIGHEDQGSQGYSAFNFHAGPVWSEMMMMNQGIAALILRLFLLGSVIIIIIQLYLCYANFNMLKY